MTGEPNQDLVWDLARAHYPVIGGAAVFLHGGLRVAFAAGGSGDTALAIVSTVDPVGLILASLVQLSIFIFIPALVIFGMALAVQNGTRWPGAAAMALCVVLGLLYASALMTVLLVVVALSSWLFPGRNAGRQGRVEVRADRPRSQVVPLSSALMLFVFSAAMLPIRPVEIIRLDDGVSVQGRVYGEEGRFLVVDTTGPLRYVPLTAVRSRAICSPGRDMNSTAVEWLGATGYPRCPG